MKDLMTDIETMGVGCNAAMIQLAGCYFDRKTGEIGRTFCENLNLGELLDYGFTKEPSTEKWWSEQNQDILKDILENNRPVKEVIREFSLFMSSANYIWCHTNFDFVIIQNYLTHFKERKMPYKGARDIRTLVDLSGIDLSKYDWSKKTHNALEDCKFQVQYCVDALNLFNKGK